jgi:hypothetical protein
MGDNVGSSAGKYYTVQNNIDASSTAGWNGGTGFTPIGTEVEAGPVNPFMGSFNGNGKVISGLTVAPTNIESGVALFGCVGSNGVVMNVGLTGCNVTCIGGVDGVACLVGGNYGTVSGCYADGAASGSEAIGGLVGGNVGTVTGCHANVDVTGYGQIGGLVGQNEGVVSACYATGSGTSTGDDGTPENSAGGLIGTSWTGGTVSDSYATGTVTGKHYVAGLMGYGGGSGLVIRCYATGPVLGGITVGGLVATNESTVVSESYWDKQTSGRATSAGGTGKTTAQMKPQATFTGWDFTTVWIITENVTYPQLRTGWDAGYQNIGGGWRRLSWFGDYIPMGGAGWIWHNKHGFLFAPASSTPQNVWMYAQDMGWLYTGNALYPFLYRAGDGAWLWYNGARNPRWFFNYSASAWESRP